jgi:hypothetical protein
MQLKSGSTPQVRITTLIIQAEHTIAEHTYKMEVQIVHEAIEGTYKNQAVLSFLIEENPGRSIPAISEWNLINLPNPDV